jgi:broad specificity phosphatase PhoE
MRLHFLRHAESVANVGLKSQFGKGDQLSPYGLDQAEAVVETLLQSGYDKIYVSPSLRTLQTIAPDLRRSNQRATILPICSEIPSALERVKNLLGKKRPKTLKIPEIYQDLFAPHPGFTAPAMRGESLIDVAERLRCFERYILESYGPTLASVLLVSHGRFGRELIQRLLGYKVSHPENAKLWRMSGTMRPFILEAYPVHADAP